MCMNLATSTLLFLTFKGFTSKLTELSFHVRFCCSFALGLLKKQQQQKKSQLNKQKTNQPTNPTTNNPNRLLSCTTILNHQSRVGNLNIQQLQCRLLLLKNHDKDLAGNGVVSSGYNLPQSALHLSAQMLQQFSGFPSALHAAPVVARPHSSSRLWQLRSPSKRKQATLQSSQIQREFLCNMEKALLDPMEVTLPYIKYLMKSLSKKIL